MQFLEYNVVPEQCARWYAYPVMLNDIEGAERECGMLYDGLKDFPGENPEPRLYSYPIHCAYVPLRLLPKVLARRDKCRKQQAILEVKLTRLDPWVPTLPGHTYKAWDSAMNESATMQGLACCYQRYHDRLEDLANWLTRAFHWAMNHHKFGGSLYEINYVEEWVERYHPWEYATSRNGFLRYVIRP